MSRRAPTPVIALSAVAALAAGALGTTAVASTPSSTTVNVPSGTGRTIATKPWTGQIIPAAEPDSDCSEIPLGATSDSHAIKINVPGGVGLYKKLTAIVTIK